MHNYIELTGNELKLLSVLVIWLYLDQFHIWSKWKALAQKIPKKTIEIIKIKSNEFCNRIGTYYNISEIMGQ